MADETQGTPGAPGDGGEPEKPRRTRGAFNKEDLATLDEAEQVVRAAQDPAYAATLAGYGITAEAVADLGKRAERCRRLLTGARDKDHQSRAATGQKEDLDDAVIAAIRRIQTGARLKHDGDDANLARYFIGEDLAKSESQLAQAAQSLLDVGPGDNLPGVKAEHYAALQSALEAWQAAGEVQGDTDDDAVGNRSDARQLLIGIKRDKRKIQIAADGEWPYTNPANAQTRRAFDLSPRRPFV